MIKLKRKKTQDLNNGEHFKFQNDKTNYEVVDYVYYRELGKKKIKLLPQNILVECWKTI